MGLPRGTRLDLSDICHQRPPELLRTKKKLT
jgi:hypothetical protein